MKPRRQNQNLDFELTGFKTGLTPTISLVRYGKFSRRKKNFYLVKGSLNSAPATSCARIIYSYYIIKLFFTI